MNLLKRQFRLHPAKVLYLLGAAGLLCTMLFSFALDAVCYAAGIYREQTVTLSDAGLYTLVNLEQTAPDTLTAVTGDAQLLLQPGQRVRRLRLLAEYPQDASSEMDLYWHLPGSGYSAARRVWPAPAAGGGWSYTLPWYAGRNLRLDLADQSGVRIRVTAIVLNERPAWYAYFLPSLHQLFWLAAAPGLAACALLLFRDAAALCRTAHNKGVSK